MTKPLIYDDALTSIPADQLTATTPHKDSFNTQNNIEKH